jgi:RNA polymerase primary sigma factor
MSREQEFAKILEDVKALARGQGNMVTEAQVMDAFAGLSLSGEQMQMVYDYLLQSKIGIGQHLDPEEYLTEKEMDYLEEYLSEIEGLGDVTEGEKEAITLSAMAGDADAQTRLTEIYLKEVPQIAKLYAGQGVYLEDLIGEGNVALAIGVSMLGSQESAQEALGLLGKMIMDAMESHIRENTDAKKLDAKVADKVNLVADKARELSEELRRNVTVQELAEESGLSENAIRDAIRMSGFKIEGIDLNE